MNRFKFFSSFTICVLLLFLFTFSVWAADLEVTCGTDGCDLSSENPLFSEDNFYPTEGIIKTVRVKNNYAERRDFAVKIEDGTFSDSDPSLSQKMTVAIGEEGSIVYGPKTIAEWKDDGLVVLSGISAGGEKVYDFNIYLSDVDNDFQGKKLAFDLNLGFDTLPSMFSPIEFSSVEETISEGGVLGEAVGSVLGEFLPKTGSNGLVLAFVGALLILGLVFPLTERFLDPKGFKN